MSTFRPLPSRPSLEHARKESKALLRRLRAGDSEALALARLRHPQFDNTAPPDFRLADAQLVIARDHGFVNWPRLVRYLDELERQQHAHVQLHGGPREYEARARNMVARHGKRGILVGRALAAYVPRFYGLPLDDVFASTITEDDARLATARMYGAPSWEMFVERLEGNARTKPGEWEVDPMRRASEAIEASDVSALERAVAEHPELLHPSEYDLSAGHTLMMRALWQERKRGIDAMRPIMDWLEAHGFDRQWQLNFRLCGAAATLPGELHALLDQGADPNWVAPNGIPVLEHALLRWRNGEAVDVLASYVKPRRALWIAAGLGDIKGMRRFLDARGRPTPEARQHRPDFIAVGWPAYGPPLPDADDEEILFEALYVAMINGRTAVLEYLGRRGAPVNSLIFKTPLIIEAVYNGLTEAVDGLILGGADLDLRGGQHNETAREIARTYFEAKPDDPERRRILELCGMDPDAVLAERNAQPPKPPEVGSDVHQAVAFAREDAAYLGQLDVRPENLLFGLLRTSPPARYMLRELGRMDAVRFNADLAHRLGPAQEVSHSELPLDRDTEATLEAATAVATANRREVVYFGHLLHALTRSEDDAVGQLLARYGVSVAKVNAGLEV